MRKRAEGSATDESTVMLAAGLKVATVEGDPMLEKLTTPADWERAEAMLASRLIPRTGMGFDVHAFAGEGPIMLGGIAVPHSRGLAGHSDADVVLHAITDALLGAAGLGDIGEHFPLRTRNGRARPRTFSSRTRPSCPRSAAGSSIMLTSRSSPRSRRSGPIVQPFGCGSRRSLACGWSRSA